MTSLPEALANEVRAERGGWQLYGARFVRSFPDGASRPGAWITLTTAPFAEIELTAASRGHARSSKRALARGGYCVASIRDDDWLFARRPLRGARELASEVRRLELVAEDPAALERLPRRRERGPAERTEWRAGAVPSAALRYLQALDGWNWSWTAVQRVGRPALVADARGWSIAGWCSVLVHPGEEPQVHVGATLFVLSAAAESEPARIGALRAALSARLRDDGYRPLRFRRATGPTFFHVHKSVRTLAAAGVERARLDTLIAARLRA